MKRIRILAIIFAIVISLAAVAAALFLFTASGAVFAVNAAASRMLGPGNLSYERLEGSLFKGVRVFNMELRRPMVLRPGSLVRVQEFNMRLVKFSIDGIASTIINARVIDPKADAVVFNGQVNAGKYDANIYSKSLSLSVLRQVMRHFRNPPIFSGELADIDLYLSGSMFRPSLKGTFRVGRIPQNGFVLEDVPVRCDLYFVRNGGLWGTYGKIFIERGWLKGPRSSVRIEKSVLTFEGLPRNPGLDIHATATVAHTHIDILIKGTRRDPKVSLSSDLSLPQETLMLMLTTGKRWDSLSGAAVNQKMTAELAGDFVDYFFFGGSGQEVAKFFGLSGISYRLDQTTQAVKFNKDISDRLDVGYGVGVKTSEQNRHKELTQTVESEYRVTDRVTLGAQKEILPAVSSVSASDSVKRTIPDDRVFLRYKTRF